MNLATGGFIVLIFIIGLFVYLEGRNRARQKVAIQMFQLLKRFEKQLPLDQPPIASVPSVNQPTTAKQVEVTVEFSWRGGAVKALFKSTGVVRVDAWEFRPKFFSPKSRSSVADLEEHLTLSLQRDQSKVDATKSSGHPPPVNVTAG